MFTPRDIRAIAVRIEQNGEAVYQRAADLTGDQAMAELFRWMAEDEGRHARFFAAMGEDAVTPEGLPEAERLGQGLLQEMVKGQTFALDAGDLAEVRDIHGFIRQSVAFEEDTILFYQFLADLVEDQAVKRQLTAIIAEERCHVAMLTEMDEPGLRTGTHPDRG